MEAMLNFLIPKQKKATLFDPFFLMTLPLSDIMLKGPEERMKNGVILISLQISDVRSLAQPFCTCLFGIAGVGWTPALPSGHRLETCQALPRTSACSEGWSRGLSAVKLYCSPERQFKNFLRNRR